MTFILENLVRENIRKLRPYSSARSEFSGHAGIYLDANENPFGSPAGEGLNRYPDPLQSALKRRIAELNDLEPSQIFIGNGSDEAIDLLFRTFCEPGRHGVIVCPPTYGMYEVSAAINGVEAVKVSLTADFQLDVDGILSAVSSNTKLIFICSPNNPTGNLMDAGSILEITDRFDGIVVVDEAYIQFADHRSLTCELRRLPNLVVLQTFSKAWGMAGLRVGMAFAGKAIIDLLTRLKPPYNVSTVAQTAALDALSDPQWMEDRVLETWRQRSALSEGLKRLPIVKQVFPSDANFILFRTEHAGEVYDHLAGEGIVVRDRSKVELCNGCLRVTVGTPDENADLLAGLEQFRVLEADRSKVGALI